MFGFIKKMFLVAMTFFGCNVLNANPLSETPLKWISMNNQECKVTPQIFYVNSDKPVFFHFSIKTCSGSDNNINGPYAKMCVPDVVENVNARVFNLMSKTSETRHIKWYETCKYKCRLDASVCNNKQRWNEDKCRCECKELIDKGVGDKGFIWSPSNCECKCDKSCDVGEHLDYENCKCRKRLVDKLVEECSESTDEVKMVGITLFEHENVCTSYCRIYVVLITVILSISIGIDAYFVYSHWYLKNDVTRVKFGTCTQTAIWYIYKWKYQRNKH